MARYLSCRFEVRPGEAAPIRRLCLESTTTKLYCAKHAAAVEATRKAFFEKPIVAVGEKKQEPIRLRKIWP